MNKATYQDCLNHNNALLFKITSKCNDNCSFCIEHKYVQNKRPDLSLDKIKKNYNYFKDKLNIDYVIISGAEPTLHPEFFKILDYFFQERVPFRVISNLINFSERKFVDKIVPYYSNFKNDEQAKLTKIIGSINDLPEKNRNSALRFEGLENLLSKQIPVMMTLVLYRQNIDNLNKIVEKIKERFENYNVKLYLELRFIYLKGTLEKLIKKSLPPDVEKIIIKIENTIKKNRDKNINFTLWNIPLCYFKSTNFIDNIAIQGKLMRRFIKINNDYQFSEARVRNWERYLKSYKVCRHCKLSNVCSGIDKEYINKYNYPILKNIN